MLGVLAAWTAGAQIPSPNPDLNRDGVVDAADTGIVRASYGRRCGQAGFNAIADLTRDCAVNLTDLNTVSRAVGTKIDDVLRVQARTAPAPNAAGWSTTDATVSFTCTGTVTGDTCPSPIVVSQQGANQVVTGTGVDTFGNRRTASATVNLDNTGPTLSITAPADGATVSATPVTVTGTAADGISGLSGVLCNGAPAVLKGSSYSCSVALVTGVNPITVEARDVAGNAASLQIAVRLETTTADTTPPVLAVGSPASGAVLFQNRPPIDVTFSDASGVNLSTLAFTSNGTALVVNCALSGAGGRCTPTAPLPEGAVRLVVSLRDTIGNEATATIDVTVDSAPVPLDITAPQDRLITRAATLDVSGTVGTGVTDVQINGVAAPVNGTSFAATVPLRDGVNMIVAVATKANGKTGTDSIDVTRDTIAPIVRIDSPSANFISANNSIPVTGLVNDVVNGGLNATVIVNGTPAVVSDGTFMVTSIPLVRGPNTIEAIARDFVGNESRHSVTVRYDSPVGARLAIQSGNGQAAVVRQLLPQPFVAVVKDDAGNPVAGRVVRFSVSRNNGLLQLDAGAAGQRSVQVPTDGSGRATVLLTLGDTAGQGNNRVLVSALGVTGEIEFCASALTAPPQKILMTMGDNQRGAVGQPLATPLEALVADRDGNPVKGLPVKFAVTKGGGSIDGAAEVTRATGVDGIARAILALGPDPGISSNVVTATFEGLTTLPATFTASALVPGDPAQTRFRGVVLDNGLTPIPGAIVKIDHTTVSGTTDAEGQFVLENVPVGKIHLIIDPSKSPRPETFPPLAFETVTIAGQANVLGQPIMIPALDTSGSRIVGGPEDVVLKMPGVPGLELTVFANSVTCRDGSKQCRVTISQVHLDKVPMPPPSGTIFMPPAWTVQPGGTRFHPPARISIPNDGMPPGRQIDIFQFDHDLNQFINIGKGTTTEDGLLIISDPGFGISSAGWGGCGQPQPPTTCAASPGPCEKCDTSTGQIVPDTAKNGSTCDDKNACTKETACKAGKCEGGKPVTNTTGSQADIDAWMAYLKKCGASKTLEDICKDAGIGGVDAKVGRSQPGVITDSWDTKEIDLDDLDSIDKLRCSWSGDSCQDIIHFLRERLSPDFPTGHANGFADETKYRKEKGYTGVKLACIFKDTNADGVDDQLVCTYDDNADGTPDRTETLELDANGNYTKVICKP
jgi:hypothetical protein